MPDVDLLLQFDNNVVEHLGLKLYQNKPTRVIAEVVSNCWDADAESVRVNMDMESKAEDRWIAVIDDGHGMARATLSDSYLVIGRDKRTREKASPRGRDLMGRKGIGKLAPFGIARKVDVVTSGVSEHGAPEVSWLRLDLDAVLAQGPKGAYPPEQVYLGGDLDALPVDQDPTRQVAEWVQHVRARNGLGTLILMRDLSLKKAIPEAELVESLGRRFTVTFKNEFVVTVNTVKVESSAALPKFEFRIPDGNDTVAATVGGRPVSFWVGFVESASWPQDQAGIGVYAHGKIAQDRPFTFGAKGREIFTRYMYGVVEADWLDDLGDDLISTDRTSLNWEADEAKDLLDWGRQKVGEWTRKFEAWRKENEKGKNRDRLNKNKGNKGFPKVTEAEQDQIVDLMSRITPRMGKDEDAEAAKDKLLKALSEAWVQKPMQKLVRDLWVELGEKDGIPPESFGDLVTRLSSYGIPESLNLAVIFAQRAFALTKLHDYVYSGIEPDLQKLIERFPWIVEPDLAVLTANQQLRTVIDKAEKEGHLITGRRAEVGGVPDANKPDFVFLSSPEEKVIVVVELKSPQIDLNLDNCMQLGDYMIFLRAHHKTADVRGVLVGRNGSGVTPTHIGMTVVPWTEVLERSRNRHIELLAAMLLQAGDGSGDDVRIAAALNLGGKDARKVLESLAQHHADLRKLMDEFEAKADKNAADGAVDAAEGAVDASEAESGATPEVASGPTPDGQIPS